MKPLIAALLSLISINLCLAQAPIISGYSYTHKSQQLQQQRRYMVSLPERYHMTQQNYPSLYVIDADFQFQHVAALARNLERMGKIPPIIVIGIANQGPKDYVYQTTWPAEDNPEFGGAQGFHQYLTQELLPLVEKEFRTNQHKVLAGYSLGGLFTLYSMMQSDTPFDAFVAMSPSTWFDNYSTKTTMSKFVEQQKQSLPPLFLSVANEQGMGVSELSQNLEKIAPSNWHWQFKKYPNENHFSTAAPALIDALTFLNPDFHLDTYGLHRLENIQQVLEVFKQKKKQWAGFRFEWLQAYQLAKYLFQSKQQEQALWLIQQVKKDFPGSETEVAVQLAKGFIAKQQPKQAIQLLEKVKTNGVLHPEWNKQMASAYQTLKQANKAKAYKEKALLLAQKYQLPSWQVWELE